MARFERSTLSEHKETRTVVLRFLKIISPVQCVIPNYDGNIMPPEEGELHRRFRRKAGVDQLVWSVNIDKKSLMARGLQLLWDTSCNGQTTYLDSTNNGSNPGASQPSHCSLNAALIVFSSCIVDLNVLMPQHMTYNKTILPNFRLIQWTALALCNCSRTKLKKITVIPSSRS